MFFSCMEGTQIGDENSPSGSSASSARAGRWVCLLAIVSVAVPISSNERMIIVLTCCRLLTGAEEKAARMSKDHTLQRAYRCVDPCPLRECTSAGFILKVSLLSTLWCVADRDLQSLQKCCRELESAKAEAQRDVHSLTQRYVHARCQMQVLFVSLRLNPDVCRLASAIRVCWCP